ncbi:hypothetical protein BDZ89DRAFT_977090 [Hymenopellis radicata]|nr:hypothetical protein BDZ89DRAFT_977090 [Hymenopellis radicata]
MDPATLHPLILRLGGNIEDFFSKHVTHLITDLPIPPSAGNKENNPKISTRQLNTAKSPSKYRNRNYDLVIKAAEFKIKVWNTSKLSSILERCLSISPPTNASRSPEPIAAASKSLANLLESERVNGSAERDPSQRRHDYQYFKRGSAFVLVEDIFGKIATVITKEYPQPRDDAAPSWPVLYCHPKSRNPFTPFHDKEKRRWEKTKREEQEKKELNAKKLERMKLKHAHEVQQTQNRRPGDLRRAASMNNLRRYQNDFDLDEEEVPEDSANASGYWSGNVAASGNSVAITSTVGTTTSTSGQSRLAGATVLLKGINKQEFLTSRKGTTKDDKTVMGPPPVPTRTLKKSKSTNTIRQAKRQEGQKPGYCECCRAQFKDFKTHVTTDRKHRKFARTDANFKHLDIVLNRIQRKTIEEGTEAHWMPFDM